MPNTFSVNLYPVPTEGGTDERLVVSSTVVEFATTWYDENTKFVYVDVQGADIMATFDGSTPSASNGHKFVSGFHGFWSARQADSAKMIRAGGTDAAVQASPFTV
tara:strand:- start:344 stop:658 length:315 start_codon:yes stop_codon:yes gene_type:complete